MASATTPAAGTAVTSLRWLMALAGSPVLDVRVEDRAAADGEHAFVLAQRAGRGFAFELAEGGLALLDEDVADRLARGRGDVRVGVAEAGAEEFGQ